MFWLRYRQMGDTTWTQAQFGGLSSYRKPEATRINGETLRGNLSSHVKSKRGTYAVVISADESGPYEAFFEDLWSADLIQISFLATPNASSDADGILVVTEGGQIPVEFIDGFENLREYAFSFRSAVGGV